MISTRIIYNAVLKTEEVDDLHKSQVAPAPTGSYPYRLKLEHNTAESLEHKMVFHMTGDTGGPKSAECLTRGVGQMTEQYYSAAKEDQPSFLYHLGDIVYHFGEAEGYEEQFLKPFECYPAPIYAIAGNHDTDINPDREDHYDCLEAFYTAFCNSTSKTIYFGEKSRRKSQVQPHVYWTMESPLAIIIGLHTNVPKYGSINREQKNWFVKELLNAAENNSGKALIVCMHHAPYSADVNHGSSRQMIEFLESAFAESGVKPDAVFSGHVHNYQRFSKQYKDGKNVAYIVAGAGGFEELHQLADPYDTSYETGSAFFEEVHLNNYCDNRHGFLKISIEKTPFNFTLSGEYYTIPLDPLIEEATLFDSFAIDLTGR